MEFPLVKDFRRGGSGGSRRRGRRGGRGGQRCPDDRSAAAEVSKEPAQGDRLASDGSDDEEREDDEATATFARRQVRSNWDRYDEERHSDTVASTNSGAALAASASVAQPGGGDDFYDVLQRAGTAASQPRLDDDLIPDSAAAAAMTLGDPAGAATPTSVPQSALESAARLKRIDMTAVLDSIHRLPVGVRLLLGSEAEDYLHSRAYGDGTVLDSFKHYWQGKAPCATQPSKSPGDVAAKAPARLSRSAVGLTGAAAPAPSSTIEQTQPPAAAAYPSHAGSQGRSSESSKTALPVTTAKAIPAHNSNAQQQQPLSLPPVNSASRSSDGLGSRPSAARAAEAAAASASRALVSPAPPALPSASASQKAASGVAPRGSVAVSPPPPPAASVVVAPAKSLEEELDELLAL